MLVAAIDSATLTLSVALCEVGGGDVRVLAETRVEGKGGHGERLPGALLDLLSARGHGTADVGAWVCGLGPGSFTGLRIGLATWKGFAYAHRRPLLGGSSLAAMALEAAPRAPADALLVPLLDARKGEVYAGFYRPDGARVAAEAALGPDALLARLAADAQLRGARAFGHGLAAYPALAGVARAEGPDTPSAAAVARLLAPALERATWDATRVFALEPHYVRPSEAEVKFPHGLGPGAVR